MKKIPLLLSNKFDNKGNRIIGNDINDKVSAVIGKAVSSGVMVRPTLKKDGTAVMFDGEKWFARRCVKPGKTAPEGFIEVEHDRITGKTFGWEPVEKSPFAKEHKKALVNFDNSVLFPGATFELVSPKINGNPENVDSAQLMKHGASTATTIPDMDDIVNSEDIVSLLKPFFEDFREEGVEGVVWWVEDTPVAKLRVKDFFPEEDSRFVK